MFGGDVRSIDAPSGALLVLGIGATASVAAHAAALWLGCLRSGVRLLPRVTRHDREVQQITYAAPATVGQAGLNALRTVVALVVANTVAGGVVAFQFAMVFFYLPAALGAKAFGVPMLRRLSDAFDRADDSAFRRAYSDGIRLTAFIAIPAACAYLLLARPIVGTVAFGEIATTHGIMLVAVALTALAPGVLGEASFLLGSYAAYARRDVRTPLRSMTLRTLVTVGGMVAAAMWTDGTTLMIALGLAVTGGNLIASSDLMMAHLRWMSVRDLLPSIARTLIASLVMVAVSFPVLALVEAIAGDGRHRLLTGIATGVAGAIAYIWTHRILRSPELAALLRIASRPDAPAVLQRDEGQSVTAEGDGTTVTKVYSGRDAHLRAQREFDRLRVVWERTSIRDDIDSPRPVGIELAGTPTVRMTRLDGERIDSVLASRELDPTTRDLIASRMAVALATYVDATHEPYHDLHFRNALYSPDSGRVGIVDFDPPAHLDDIETDGTPTETSIGNLIGSTLFEIVRPRNILQPRFRRQALDVCVGVSGLVGGDPDSIETIAELVYARAAFRGAWYRRAWYRTVAAVARPAFPHQVHVTEVAPRQPLVITPKAAAIVLLVVAVVSAVVASSAPFYTAVVSAALVFAVVVAIHPPVAAYTLLAITPLVVGLNRSTVVPALRVNEVVVLLAGAALIARGIVLWAIQARPTRFRLRKLEVALGALLVTGSILPIVWLGARGRAITRDDVLYALVLWKLVATYFVIRAAVRSEQHVRKCLWISFASVSVVAVIGIGQALEVAPITSFVARFFAPDGLTAIVTNNRATSTIGNAIAFADVMAIHAAVAAAWIIRRHRRRVVLFALAALFAVAALASGQLSGVLALFIAAIATSFITRRRVALAVAAIPIIVLALVVLRPVVEQRLSRVDPSTNLPQSWVARGQNLDTYFLPELSEPKQIALGVRPAARVPAHEGWRDWVYIESGYVWILWTGGIPFLIAFLFYLWRAYRSTSIQARHRSDAVGVAAVGAVAALAIVAVLMALDPHLTMRGTADASVALLALATAPIPFLQQRALTGDGGGA
jgi:hypothetical protein